MLASQSANAPHERIGRYEVLRKIATGGMAELFLAKQVGMEGFEKVVAIKRILAHLAYDEEFINMFRDEARIVAKLSHPNIVQIYDLGKSDDSYFIAMEYIPGRNLSSIAKKAKQMGEVMPPEYVARCIGQACEGLYYAHMKQDAGGKPMRIVHRDVSPQNIIVAFSGTVKLVDFGIAKAATKIAHTRAGVLKGKYAYMSPEQIRGEETDARSDLFAVGIVLYELLCGRRPFEKENSIQTLKAIVQDPHIDPRVLNPMIPDPLAEIINHALEKNPSQRFQDAQEVQIALEDFVGLSPVRVNNITISRWVSELFSEELSKERGGTVNFQGVGEIILPEVEVEDRKARTPSDQPERPMTLARGRGGGSLIQRPPIPAPSTRSHSLFSTRESERGSLIEEGVIDGPRASVGGYDDAATVHANGKVAYSDDKTATASQSSEDVTIAPGLFKPPEPTRAEPRPAATIDVQVVTPEDSSGLLTPLESSEDFPANDDPWNEATVGYPDGAAPVHVEDEASVDDFQLPAVSDPSDGWQGDALSLEDDPWNDKTSANPGDDAEDLPMPVVQEPIGLEDSPLDLDDFADATLSQSALDEALADATIGGDATLGGASIFDQDDDFEADRTLSAAKLGGPSVSLRAWGADPTIAGGAAVDVEEVTGEASAFERSDGEHTVRAMDEEPALPVPRTNRNIDQDARTVAGMSADYASVGLEVPVGGGYDPLADKKPERVESAPPVLPPKRGQERLGAIKLSKVAVSTGFDEEVTTGESSARLPAPERKDKSYEARYDARLEEPVQPRPLEPPPEDRPRPPPRISSLVGVPQPLMPLNPGSPMGIGSTNVPPASLSLSQVLSHPARASRSGLVALPRAGSAVAPRSGSLAGRQIKEVVRDGMPAPAGQEAAFGLPAPEVPPLQVPPVGGGARAGLRKLLVGMALSVLLVALAAAAYFALPLVMGPPVPLLIIRTLPEGAAVFVDGARQNGMTPITLRGLRPGGTYTVRLERPGFEPQAQVVAIPAKTEQPLLLQVSLKPAAEGAPAPPP